ncbi:hypothetical protein [Paenibacillus sp. N3.4]|nr:hypothetical protein [Paenibacillus sp. N3.4]
MQIPQICVGGETATQYDTKTVVERDTRVVTSTTMLLGKAAFWPGKTEE